MEQLREKGDYNCVFSISEEELKTIVAPAQELVKVISELIGYSKEDNVEIGGTDDCSSGRVGVRRSALPLCSSKNLRAHVFPQS